MREIGRKSERRGESALLALRSDVVHASNRIICIFYRAWAELMSLARSGLREGFATLKGEITCANVLTATGEVHWTRNSVVSVDWQRHEDVGRAICHYGLHESYQLASHVARVPGDRRSPDYVSQDGYQADQQIWNKIHELWGSGR